MSVSVTKFYSKDLAIRASAIVLKDPLREMCITQELSPLATMAVARTSTAAILMASHMREGQSIGIYFHGDGALNGVYAEAGFTGELRGYCGTPSADLPLAHGHLDVAGGIGRGHLTVIRNIPFQKQPTVGTVEIETGDIAKDLCTYLHQSLQIPSILALSAILDEDGKLSMSAGILIEVMPGAKEASIASIEEQIPRAKPLTDLMKMGATPIQLVTEYVKMPLELIEHNHEIKFVCKCSKERIHRSLVLLGEETISDMLAEKKTFDIKCEFCGKKFNLTTKELENILMEMKQDNSTILH